MRWGHEILPRGQPQCTTTELPAPDGAKAAQGPEAPEIEGTGIERSAKAQGAKQTQVEIRWTIRLLKYPSTAEAEDALFEGVPVESELGALLGGGSII